MIDCRGKTLPQIKKELMNVRGITNLNAFMEPSLNYLIPFREMKNLPKACSVINQALNEKKIIGIHFDTDTDGTCSGGIMYNYLIHHTSEAKLRTYTDIGKAHGLRNFDIDKMAECDVIIIVDSLDNNIDKYKLLHDMGKTVIILDHHDINPDIPYDDYAILVSSQDKDYKNHALCGAGVCLKVCLYLDILNNTNYADKYYDLAACGLIADMVDISETHMENRAIIYKGLSESYNPAIQFICGQYVFDSNAVSYYIAPKINALCRTSRNEEGYLIFTKYNESEIAYIIDKMDEAKTLQNAEVDRILSSGKEQVFDNITFMQIHTDYGVSGLVANSLVEKYHKPAIVLYDEISSDDNCLHGSARSPMDMFRSYCENFDHVHTGGHEAAFGIWFDTPDDLPKYLDEINNNAQQFKGQPKEADMLINIKDITINLITFCQKFNFVSGIGSLSIEVELADMDSYTIGSFKNGKHTFIESSSPDTFTYRYAPKCIQWNLPQDVFEKYVIENKLPNLHPKGTLQFGFKNTAQIICNDLIPEDYVKEHTIEQDDSKDETLHTNKDINKILNIDNNTMFGVSDMEYKDISMELS